MHIKHFFYADFIKLIVVSENVSFIDRFVNLNHLTDVTIMIINIEPFLCNFRMENYKYEFKCNNVISNQVLIVTNVQN